MNNYSIVSADSHVVEPANLWLDYIEPKFRGQAPRIKREASGLDTFFCEGGTYGSPGKICGAGRFDTGMTLEDVYPGGYDPHARVKEIAADGVDAEVLYTSVGMRLYSLPNAELRRACFSAYNAWLADFCKPYPQRFRGIGLIDLTDVDYAVAECRRARKLGLGGVMISDDLESPDLYAQADRDPFWRTAEELGLPVSLHFSTSTVRQQASAQNMGVVQLMFSQIPMQRAIVQMIFDGVFLRFPGLKVVAVESEASWALSLCQRMDWIYQREHMAFKRDYAIKDKGMLPSEYFRRNMAMTIIWDRPAVLARDLIGIETLMWSSDYPHRAAPFPKTREFVEQIFQGVPADAAHQIMVGNAQKLYGF